ncbi:DNA mismatch repair protein, partial [Nocardia sp. BSTN01]|uniref:MutS-related protein n=1 Tax=Nocardia sp. BSTN01 TaxID=2783665 RepID=UPI0018902F30
LVRAVHDLAAAATSVRRWTSTAGRRANGTLVLALPPFTEQLELLRGLRTLLERDGDRVTATGWTDLIATTTQFDDTYLQAVRDELSVLRFDHGVEFDAGLGTANKITDVVVHRPPPARRTRFGTSRGASVFDAIADGDATSDPVMQLKDHALAELADVVAAAADELHAFFLRLRDETAFYLGCLILRDHLDRTAIPYCLPRPHPSGTTRLHCRGLRDITLALGPAPATVAGSDLAADGRSLLIVTGANNGGKSTFLRSIGAAQLMMQAGMFVLAEEFAADVRDGVFTHVVGDEDHTLSYGKLADELVRMNAVVDRIGPHGMLLCNEAFASTGERDAGRIAGPLLRALTEAGVKVVFVTHLHDYARTRHADAHPGDLFLRAERRADGTRTHRIVPGPPEPGGHGYDLWTATELG